MRNRQAKLVPSLAVISAAVLAVSGSLASADGSSTGGEVHVYEADTALDGNLGTDILTGAIEAWDQQQRRFAPLEEASADQSAVPSPAF